LLADVLPFDLGIMPKSIGHLECSEHIGSQPHVPLWNDVTGNQRERALLTGGGKCSSFVNENMHHASIGVNAESLGHAISFRGSLRQSVIPGIVRFGWRKPTLPMPTHPKLAKMLDIINCEAE
jgi:hypothetical protein